MLTSYALVKVRWTCLRCSLFAHLLPRIRSVTRLRLSVGDSHTLVGLSCLPRCCWSVVLALLVSVDLLALVRSVVCVLPVDVYIIAWRAETVKPPGKDFFDIVRCQEIVKASRFPQNSP